METAGSGEQSCVGVPRQDTELNPGRGRKNGPLRRSPLRVLKEARAGSPGDTAGQAGSESF